MTSWGKLAVYFAFGVRAQGRAQTDRRTGARAEGARVPRGCWWRNPKSRDPALAKPRTCWRDACVNTVLKMLRARQSIARVSWLPRPHQGEKQNVWFGVDWRRVDGGRDRWSVGERVGGGRKLFISWLFSLSALGFRAGLGGVVDICSGICYSQCRLKWYCYECTLQTLMQWLSDMILFLLMFDYAGESVFKMRKTKGFSCL